MVEQLLFYTLNNPAYPPEGLEGTIITCEVRCSLMQSNTYTAEVTHTEVKKKPTYMVNRPYGSDMWNFDRPWPISAPHTQPHQPTPPPPPLVTQHLNLLICCKFLIFILILCGSAAQLSSFPLGNLPLPLTASLPLPCSNSVKKKSCFRSFQLFQSLRTPPLLNFHIYI